MSLWPRRSLDGLGVGAQLDQQRRARVAQIVGPHGFRQPGVAQGGDHRPLAEAVAVQPVGRRVVDDAWRSTDGSEWHTRAGRVEGARRSAARR